MRLDLDPTAPSCGALPPRIVLVRTFSKIFWPRLFQNKKAPTVVSSSSAACSHTRCSFISQPRSLNLLHITDHIEPEKVMYYSFNMFFSSIFRCFLATHCVSSTKQEPVSSLNNSLISYLYFLL